MSSVRVKVGRPDAAKLASVTAAVSAIVVKSLAEGVIKRVQDRVDHPAAKALTTSGVNQNAAQITGDRGGPGIIRPVRARALRFTPKGGGVVFAASVRGVGLEPLIKAEANRLAQSDVVIPNERVK